LSFLSRVKQPPGFPRGLSDHCVRWRCAP